MAKLNSWLQPYTVREAGAKPGADGRTVAVTLEVRIRWWHPRLWWAALRMIRVGRA